MKTVNAKYPVINANSVNYLEYFCILDIPTDEAVITGSSLLVALGRLPKNNDLDLVVSQRVFNRLTPKSYPNETYTIDGKIEIGTKFMGWNVHHILKDAIKIDGYNFISINKLLAFYKILNRHADKFKIDVLKTLRN